MREGFSPFQRKWRGAGPYKNKDKMVKKEKEKRNRE
jgi:hypothetical protein